MACYHPIPAYRSASGEVQFHDTGAGDPLQLACGRCIGCRLERSRQWAVRLVHEASLWPSSYFVTLTYADSPRSLVYRDFRLFLRRVRRARSGTRIRFFVCGEYGEALERPHFHALLFNVDFPDKQVFSSGSDQVLWSSAELEKLWSHGFATLGPVSFETARYVSAYVVKKVTGQLAPFHYRFCDSETGEITERVPEFCQMSRRPGIGHDWLRLYHSDVYPSGTCVVQGREGKAPRYYDRIAKHLLDFEAAQLARYKAGQKMAPDSTDERLRVREKVAAAALTTKRRHAAGNFGV